MTFESVMLGSSVRCLENRRDVLMHGFIRLLSTTPEVPEVTRAHVWALEVSSEDPNQVILVMDLCGQKVLDPGLGGVG
jgi:hypothetical protein